MKKVTEKFLRIDNNACNEGYQWWVENSKPSDSMSTLKKLMADNHNDWANWLVVRLMSRDQKIQYAIYAAERVISIYEKQYPADKRPRMAIQAAKKYLKDKTDKNKKAAYAAHALRAMQKKILKYGMKLLTLS